MDFHQQASPPFLTSPLLQVPHGLFTNLDGVSSEPYASLNLGYHVGDQAAQVAENRRRVRMALGLDHLAGVHQVHGDRVLVVAGAPDVRDLPGYDALITNQPGIGLMVQQADCQAVLLWSARPQAVAAIHCGWRGSVLNIIGTTIRALEAIYDVAPVGLRAVISPSLGPCCGEFTNYQQELPAWMHAYQVRTNHFDFWQISRRQLEEAGVPGAHIEVAGLCTRCDQRFFSYRRARVTTNGTTGRQGSIIGLPTHRGCGGGTACAG